MLHEYAGCPDVEYDSGLHDEDRCSDRGKKIDTLMQSDKTRRRSYARAPSGTKETDGTHGRPRVIMRAQLEWERTNAFLSPQPEVHRRHDSQESRINILSHGHSS